MRGKGEVKILVKRSKEGAKANQGGSSVEVILIRQGETLLEWWTMFILFVSEEQKGIKELESVLCRAYLLKELGEK